MTAGRRWLFAGVGVVVLAAAAAIVVKAANVEVVAEGQLLDYTRGEIHQIEIFGRWNLYVEKESPPTVDLATAYLMSMIAGAALLLLVLRSRAPHRFPSQRALGWFLGITWFGLTYLVADELLGIHESLGHNLRFLADLPGVSRPDDVIVGIYFLGMLAYLVAFRRLLSSSRAGISALVAGAVLQGLATGGDVVHEGLYDVIDEEFFELAATLLYVVGFGLVFSRLWDRRELATTDVPSTAADLAPDVGRAGPVEQVPIA